MLISAFVCANIYSQLLVCEVRRIVLRDQSAIYQVLLTDQKWRTVNRCTGQNAVQGQPLREVKEDKWCV